MSTVTVIHGSLTPSSSCRHESEHHGVTQVRIVFGALILRYSDGDTVCYARGAWLAYEERHDAEPVAAVRDPGQPDVLLEVLADGAVRRPTPASMPPRRTVG